MIDLKKVIEEYIKLGIPEQIDYDKLYLYSIITHSTAVEGSTVTEIENRLLFDEGISPNKPIGEQMMNIDLKSAYEEAKRIAEQHLDYSVEMLCRLSALVMKNTGKEYKTAIGNFNSSNGELGFFRLFGGLGGVLLLCRLGRLGGFGRILARTAAAGLGLFRRRFFGRLVSLGVQYSICKVLVIETLDSFYFVFFGNCLKVFPRHLAQLKKAVWHGKILLEMIERALPEPETVQI